MFKPVIRLALVLLLAPLAAAAHQLNESYIYFDVTDDSLSGRFEATFEDIDAVLGVDDNSDGEVSDEEIMAHGDRIFAYFQNRLEITHEGQIQDITQGELEILGTYVGRFAQVGFDVPGITQTPETVEVDYLPLADSLGEGHLGYILIGSNTRLQMEENERYVSLIFDLEDGPQTLSLVGEPPLKLFWDFVVHGVWHIWLGFDHVAFLITLLLPAVMIALNGRWAPEEDFRSAFWTVVKIATLFTISHSVTLSLSALGLVQMPVPLVEAIIAVSIAIVALMNLFPSTHKYMLWVVFGFGLFHGFGFANVLAPLGLSPGQLVIGLAAFNIGVELGQLAIIVVVFPILWMIRRWSLYIPLALRVGSVLLIVLAGIWLAERTTEFELDVRGTVARLAGGAA